MAISVVLILALFLILIIYFEVRKFIINRKMKNFDLVEGLPIIGVIGRILGATNYDIIGLISTTFDEAKTKVFRLWIGPVLVVGVHDPASVEILLTHDDSLERPFFYDYFNCESCLISTDKERWKSNRRELNSAFSVSAVRTYIPHFNEKSRELINQMRPYLNKASNVYRIISICIIDITVRTMFGIDMHLQESDLGGFFYEIEKKIVNSIQYRFPRIWLRYDCIYHNLDKVGREEQRLVECVKSVIKKIYDRRVDDIKLQGIDEHGVFGFMEKCLQLERQGIYSSKNVMDELSAMLVAGNDTASITVFSTLLMLAINQRHQDLVVEEMRSIFESADCDVTQTHLAAMNYTERAIKESLRLLTPVSFLARRATADIDLPDGTVPKDAIVIISAMHMHRNPQV